MIGKLLYIHERDALALALARAFDREGVVAFKLCSTPVGPNDPDAMLLNLFAGAGGRRWL